MRYLLISLVAFLLFALPAFAYEPPTEPLEDCVEINVDIAAWMYFEVEEEVLYFEIAYDECEDEDGAWSEAEYLNYCICVNGDWTVEGYFTGYLAGQGDYDQDWDEDMEVWVEDKLMVGEDEGPSDHGNTQFDCGTMGKYCSAEDDDDSIYPWLVEVWAPWLEKGNYCGLLCFELWDP